MKDIDLNEFFRGEYINLINKRMMYYDYKFPFEDVRQYVAGIVKIPIQDILDYVKELEIEITSADVFQFSSFEDCTTKVCAKLLDINNPGVTPYQGGLLLLDDGVRRERLAYTKYGENHLKAGEAFGLLFSLANTYYLNGIGYVYTSLGDDEREKLIIRLLLKNSFIIRLITATNNGRVDLRQFLYMLSDSTFRRRRSNIKAVVEKLNNSGEYDFHRITDLIDFNYQRKTL